MLYDLDHVNCFDTRSRKLFFPSCLCAAHYYNVISLISLIFYEESDKVNIN